MVKNEFSGAHSRVKKRENDLQKKYVNKERTRSVITGLYYNVTANL